MSASDKAHVSIHRFFLEEPMGESGEQPVALALSADDRHHLVAALRSVAGDEIAVVEPAGEVWRMRLTSVDRDLVEGARVQRLPSSAPCRLTLIQAMAKSSKVDSVVQKAVELNVEAVIPVFTQRSVVRLDAAKRAARGERLRRVATAAAKQSKRTSIPRVSDPVSLDEAMRSLDSFDATLVLWEGTAVTAPGIGEALDELGVTSASKVALVVGPEGGLTSDEVYALESANARAVTLGETILRSETAGIVATAVCIYELGGLGGRPRG